MIEIMVRTTPPLSTQYKDVGTHEAVAETRPIMVVAVPISAGTVRMPEAASFGLLSKKIVPERSDNTMNGVSCPMGEATRNEGWKDPLGMTSAPILKASAGFR